MRLSNKIIAMVVAGVVIGGGILGVLAMCEPVENTTEIIIENEAMSTNQCFIDANEVFLQYLEDNSTTYRFDDGTIINLPQDDSVIENAKSLLKIEKDKCQ